MLKKLFSVILTGALVGGSALALPAVYSGSPLTAQAAGIRAENYSYTITPLMKPFNQYFFVKTDNPDPKSFRFVDKSTKYGDQGAIWCGDSFWDDEVTRFADIKYENKETGRVSGGYLFYSGDTDGGEVTLQSWNESEYFWESDWEDTKIKFKLPALKDRADYLISTYAKKSSFFDNMDAVQEGFSSICLYSGSYIRGKLIKYDDAYWGLSSSPHADQSFYLQSPYGREDNQKLFATYVYPFSADSLGFPSMMWEIAYRLDSSSSCEWDDYNHYLIHVTHDGETREYGGAGIGEGQGIEESQIKKYYTFTGDAPSVSMSATKKLLDEYSLLKVKDDVPKKDALTWEKICDQVGEGSWVRILDLYSVYGGWDIAYTYLYKQNDGDYFWTNPAGDNGAESYWGGDLGYFSDAWVDGRYIDVRERYVPGEKWEDHPTSSIYLKNVRIPKVTYRVDYYWSGEWNYDIEVTDIQEVRKNVLFDYHADSGKWQAGFEFDDEPEDGYYASSDGIIELVEMGLLDSKYQDMMELTKSEVKALKVDKNTDTVPLDGLVYDTISEPGKPYHIVSLSEKDVKVSLSFIKKEYTGQVLKPTVKVTYQGKTLKEKTDYRLTYSNENSKTPGTYTVKITGMGDYTGTVKKTYRIICSVKMSKTNVTLGKGETFTLSASTVPSGSSDKIVSWTSSDPSVASVSEGKVKALRTGTAVITAEFTQGQKASCEVTVNKPADAIKLDKASLTLGEGESYKLISSVTSGSSYHRTFTSSNTSILKITETTAGTCTFKALKAGTATITVKTYNGKTASCKVTVKKPAASISLNKSSLTMGAGETFKLISSVTDGASFKRTFTSSDSTILKITETTSGTCTFKALKAGTAIITVKTYNGKTASCKVTVKKPAASISISPATLTLSVGQTYRITSSVKDGASYYRYFWSADPSVAAIDSRTAGTCTIKALKKGTTTIKVKTFNGKTASCTVVVR